MAQSPFNDAKSKGQKNGGGTGTLSDYTQSVGGVDDYNNNQTIPADTYQATWITCNSGNNYCGIGRSVAEKQDQNTGLVWSPVISTASDWFTANNRAYPNGLPGDDGVCNTTGGEVACQCVKSVSAKTGCEGYDDGNWRLPYQKEWMQAYIDGYGAHLSNTAIDFWSSTTRISTNDTHRAWYQFKNYLNYSKLKTDTVGMRCVR